MVEPFGKLSRQFDPFAWGSTVDGVDSSILVCLFVESVPLSSGSLFRCVREDHTTALRRRDVVVNSF